MNNLEFVKKLISVSEMKTVYAKGGIGQPLYPANKTKLEKQYAYNKGRFDGLGSKCFAFDCCGLVKSVIWGFYGDSTLSLGGAVYESMDLKDVTEKGLINQCVISDDFTVIEAGELLYMPGHCGVYIGNGNVVESTPSWKNGVQITEISKRKWKCHGKLPQIVYNESEQKPKNEKPDIPKYYLKLGSKGMEVNKLQKCLNFVINAGLDTDGIFGPLTKNALLRFQNKYNLLIDGIYGPQCYKKLREVLK